jgi:hypothetical protein
MVGVRAWIASHTAMPIGHRGSRVRDRLAARHGKVRDTPCNEDGPAFRVGIRNRSYMWERGIMWMGPRAAARTHRASDCRALAVGVPRRRSVYQEAGVDECLARW